MYVVRQPARILRSKADGFTLLEVVVALAVLALTLGVVYETLGWSLRRSSVTQKKEIAWLHAQSILAEVRGQANSPLGLRAGSKEGESAGVKWRIEARDHASSIIDASTLIPLEVTVTVPWGPKAAETIQLQSIELVRRAP